MRQPKTDHKQPASRLTINHLLVVALAILVGLQVSISNQIATSGKNLSELELEATRIEAENSSLLAQNVAFMSLQELSLKAKSMGYIEPTDVINLTGDSRDLAAASKR